MQRIDTKQDSFIQSRQGITYEMTKHQIIDEFSMDGNVFKVNGKEVGLTIFDIKENTLTIVNFDFNTPVFGNQRWNGFGKIFLELLIDYSKKKYNCEKICAIDLTQEGYGFFTHMGFISIDDDKLCKKI